MPPTKPQLRTHLRATRATFVASLPNRPTIEATATSHILTHLPPATTLAAYVAVGDELNPAPLLQTAAAQGHTTALPHVTTRDQPMRFLRWTPGDALVPGPFGLLQPAFDAPEISPDLIVTPLLGFDRSGGRIGQGAGYYDRAFLAHPFARRIGLAWSVQEATAIPLDPWDVPLHAIATETEWIDIPGVR